jgi:hypothetical protein
MTIMQLIDKFDGLRTNTHALYQEVVAEKGKKSDEAEAVAEVFDSLTGLMGKVTEPLGYGKEEASYLKDREGRFAGTHELFIRPGADIDMTIGTFVNKVRSVIDDLYSDDVVIFGDDNSQFRPDDNKSFKGKHGALNKKLDELESLIK